MRERFRQLILAALAYGYSPVVGWGSATSITITNPLQVTDGVVNRMDWFWVGAQPSAKRRSILQKGYPST